MTITRFLIFAQLAALDPRALIPSGLVGLGIAVVAYWFVRALTTVPEPTDLDWRFDATRINELRRIDPIYRAVPPMVQFFSRINRAIFPASLPEIKRELQASGLPRFWLAEEYLARCQIIGLCLLPVFGFILWRMFGPAGLVLAATFAALSAWLLRWRLRQRARTRLAQIKRRLPFFLDLLTLLMEAGSTFIQALHDAVHEFSPQAVSVEFARVLSDINMGKAREEAFESLRDRLSDSDITSLIGAIIQGENLGTPVAAVFRTQADVLRIKRTQAAETLAGEAGVKMLFPGMLVMMAAVALILGPFLLNYLYFGLQF